MTETMTMYCAGCRAETEFERPPCADGHGDCPDLVCVDCGLAMFAFVADELTAGTGASRAGRRGARPAGRGARTGRRETVGAA